MQKNIYLQFPSAVYIKYLQAFWRANLCTLMAYCTLDNIRNFGPLIFCLEKIRGWNFFFAESLRYEIIQQFAPLY